MVATVRLGRSLRPREEQWLVKNVGARLHYLPKSIGGVGWVARCKEENINGRAISVTLVWYLSFEDDKLASYFSLKFL
jgi:hypothetical protein